MNDSNDIQTYTDSYVFFLLYMFSRPIISRSFLTLFDHQFLVSVLSMVLLYSNMGTGMTMSLNIESLVIGIKIHHGSLKDSSTSITFGGFVHRQLIMRIHYIYVF